MQNEEMQKNPRIKFFRNFTREFRNIPKEEDIDEFTFNIWKSELKRELPPFWESVNKPQKDAVTDGLSLEKHK